MVTLACAWLLSHARRVSLAGSQTVVVVAWLHRLGRRVRERVRAWEECKALSADIHSVMEGGKPQEIVFNILASVAQEEAQQLGGARLRRSLGWHRTTTAPSGVPLASGEGTQSVAAWLSSLPAEIRTVQRSAVARQDCLNRNGDDTPD
jgi:hypothetical protein